MTRDPTYRHEAALDQSVLIHNVDRMLLWVSTMAIIAAPMRRG
jgi:hypothetical protein